MLGSIQLDILVTLFVVIDPVGLVPVFLGLTRHLEPAEIKKLAIKSVILAFIILEGFIFTGSATLNYLNISIEALRIAGGILLFMLSIDMVFARHSGISSTTEEERIEAEHRPDISVFPLAIPLIAGPGAITSILLAKSKFTSNMEYMLVTSSLVFTVLLITLFAFFLSGRIMKIFGDTGANVITRVLGILLAALAVQYVLDGLALNN